ncbi:MAG: hypothetical protein HQ567_18085 [Candidatus Nealsonbacteria bacterium]|nr:hypothetical protein [Candidatus Nealsonbacteria bacterium]
MGKKLWTCGAAAMVLLLIGLPAGAADKAAVFDMEEVSVFDQGGEDGPNTMIRFATSGQSARCTKDRIKEVKKYPEFKSDNAMFGTVIFDRNQIDPNAGITFQMAIDESEGTGKGFDRLYFDLNGDLDLTNDEPVKPMADPPKGIPTSGVAFDFLSVEFEGVAPLKILPRIRPSGSTRAYVYLTAAVARQGKIKIGEVEYNALLTQARGITGRFDRPGTGLLLMPVDGAAGARPVGGGSLGSMFDVDGTLFQVSASPTGDKLTVGPFRGEGGLLKVAAGDRKKIKKLGISGSLVSADVMVPLGDRMATKKRNKYRIPVGDYAPSYLAVDFGDLTMSFSRNYYAEDGSRPTKPKAATCSFKIRKDKPFVVDFADKPAILFSSPPKEQAIKPGSSVRVGAVIVEPKLDLLLRGLQDTSKKISERTVTGPDGKKVTIPQYESLDPTVVITNSAGKKVAEGKMPFG